MAIPKTRNRLTPVSQWGSLRRKFIEGGGMVKRNRLRWDMQIQPTPLSAAYDVRLHYTLERGPRVFVRSPDLLQPGEDPIPHRYGDGSLCLYLPGTGEWDRSMPLAETIIPWTAEWLYFYEIWLGTGQWCGGGHGTPKPDELHADDEHDHRQINRPR
jgi:hypothetical protein